MKSATPCKPSTILYKANDNIYIFYICCVLMLMSSSAGAQVWTKVPTPNPGPTSNILRGISGTSSSDIWTCGYYEPVSGSFIHRNLVMHWNGSTWQQTPVPDISATNSDLYDIEAVSPTEVWATGVYAVGSAATPQIVKWNGSSWTQQSLPAISGTASLSSLHAIAANDIWAVGGTYTNAYALHYNGSSWTQVNVPLVGLLRDDLKAVHGINANDVWAVGSSRDASGQYRFMARHWNGSAWTNSTLPAELNGMLGEFLDVRMVSSNDVWAIGYYLTNGVMVKLHWNGTAWSIVTPTNGGGGALAVISTNNIFSTGADISHWNGNSWTLVDDLADEIYPALRNTYVAPNGDIWACGRTSEATNNFKTLVYRTASETPVFSGGATQAVSFNTGSINNSIDALLHTLDNDESQVLTYTIFSTPQHGSLGGFPATAITTNGTAQPTGVTYTPSAFYTGIDNFTIQVSVGSLTAQTTVTVNVSGIVPLGLLFFKGVLDNNNKTSITWKVPAETNLLSFTLQKSQDSRNFISIADIPATSALQYQYGDNNSITTGNKVYYRLKLNERNGATTYSNIINFSNSPFQPTLLYPVPAKENATLRIGSNKTQYINYIITNINGQVLKRAGFTLSNGMNNIHINLKGLVTGEYNLVLKSNSINETIRFITL